MSDDTSAAAAATTTPTTDAAAAAASSSSSSSMSSSRNKANKENVAAMKSAVAEDAASGAAAGAAAADDDDDAVDWKQQLKDEGNALFKAKKFADAIEMYTRVLDYPALDARDPLRATCLNNRAACATQLSRWRDVVDDCTAVLDIDATNVKALYRRACAAEAQGQLAIAIRDCRRLLVVDAKNADGARLIERLHKRAEADQAPTTMAAVFAKIESDKSADRELGLSALWQVCKEDDEVAEVRAHNGVALLLRLLRNDSYAPQRHKVWAILATLAKDWHVCTSVFDTLQLDGLLPLLNTAALDDSVNTGHVLAFVNQVNGSAHERAEKAIQGLFKEGEFVAPRDRDESADERTRREKARDERRKQMELARMETDNRVLAAFMSFFDRIAEHESAARAKIDADDGKDVEQRQQQCAKHHVELRLQLMNVLCKFPWAFRNAKHFCEHGGFHKLLAAAAHYAEMQVLGMTALVIAKLLESIQVGSKRKTCMTMFKARFTSYFRERLDRDDDYASVMAALSAMLALMLADNSIGVEYFGEAVEDITMTCERYAKWPAQAEQLQLISMEIFSAAAMNKDYRKKVGAAEVRALQKAVKATNLHIQARAIVSITKVALGNQEVQRYIFAESETLLDKIRAFMEEVERQQQEEQKQQSSSSSSSTTQLVVASAAKTQADAVQRRWRRGLQEYGLEALSFISAIPEVKEQIAADERLVRQLLALGNWERSTISNTTSWLPAMITFVGNMTRNPTGEMSETDKEMQDQLQKLGEFAKDPGLSKAKMHPLDEEARVKPRSLLLVANGAVALILKLAKEMKYITPGTKEMLSVVLVNLAYFAENRGRMVADGALRLLVALTTAENNTSKGVTHASQAIAKIMISVNPHMAFKNQSEYSLIRPLLSLLRSDEPLLHFESLLALTNLASMNEDVAAAIANADKGKGIVWIEGAALTEEPMLQRATAELMCNLCYLEKIAARYEEGERAETYIKFWSFLIVSDDIPARSAVTGLFAILSDSPKTAALIARFLDLDDLALCVEEGDAGVHHRVFAMLANVIGHVPDFADRLRSTTDEKAAALRRQLRAAAERSKNERVQQLGSQVLSSFELD